VVRRLSVAQQQMVEIARAVAWQPALLILDEPTSSLTHQEINELFRMLRDLKANGVAVLYISHRLEEIGQIADRATVLRDGQYVGTVAAQSTPISELIRLMVSPITALNLIPGLVDATKKNMPIINVDEKIDPKAAGDAGVKITNVIASDNKQAGGLAAKYLIDNLKDGGKVAVLEGKAGNPSGQDRHDGFVDGLKGSKFNVVASQPADWDRAKALNVATNILQSNPDLVAFYAANDTMALGVVEAIKAAGKQGKVIVIGTDAVPEALAAVKAGDMAGTVAQYPAEEAGIATSLAILALQGKAQSGFIPSPIKLLAKADVK